ncbi:MULTISPECIES: hypothetical protein [Psychrobacter]|uniref:Uncharacterized protein n=1 Tax=Psychrobacter halodurans TaxID=2818439 RepID=A0AAW4IV91_9GAMM|nr:MULTISPECIES: hypothetical protein [Psychrobacter]MBO1517079.1 hypothetical protein [Psychrobacter halodurans]
MISPYNITVQRLSVLTIAILPLQHNSQHSHSIVIHRNEQHAATHEGGV